MFNSHSATRKGGHTVAVFGATGHTGQFVITELLRRGLTPIAIARDEKRLSASGFQDRSVETRVATINSSSSLDQALAGSAAVINCAGPFLDTAVPVLEAALRAGIHYLDVTAEQMSALELFERYATPARDAGIIAVPAMGFYGGLGDMLATAAIGDWTEVDEINISIALDSWEPTQGTRLTGKRNTHRRLHVTDGKLAQLPDPAPTASWQFPEPFGIQEIVELPFTETVLIPRHVQVSALHSYLNLTPLRDLRDSSTPPPTPSDDTGRSAQIFMVDVVVRKGTETRRVIAQGRDIYAFTAPLVVEATLRILGGEAEERGVLAPGSMFDALNFLQSLAPSHLTFDVISAGDPRSAVLGHQL
ncbi:saccharopine dehydrogenase [Paenibacillus swuensis]|uniref:Saccharopine dehydrogenase n=1 Tax=Paenibacillus swuensis TaxID=1178515 RepID=A0A172TFF7_9BACL|nr:saccharopine dehydrogenase NADP-binding domain-containing protein [Paenibacillus swuensis]ANE45692.1 saccharopine dehydrogenase [Paenibacillus swuensis]